MLDGRCRGDPHLVYTVRRRVISMTRAPCRCSASPSFTLRPASLLLHSHRRRSWHDSGTPGDGFARSCWTEAYAHRASLLCGQVFLLRVCVLCGVCVSVVNISLIGVIYGSGESIHLTVAHRQKLALAHRSSPKRVFSAKLKPLALNLAELKVDLPYTAGGPIRLAHMADMPAVLIDTRGLQAPQCVHI